MVSGNVGWCITLLVQVEVHTRVFPLWGNLATMPRRSHLEECVALEPNERTLYDKSIPGEKITSGRKNPIQGKMPTMRQNGKSKMGTAVM